MPCGSRIAGVLPEDLRQRIQTTGKIAGTVAGWKSAGASPNEYLGPQPGSPQPGSQQRQFPRACPRFDPDRLAHLRAWRQQLEAATADRWWRRDDPGLLAHIDRQIQDQLDRQSR